MSTWLKNTELREEAKQKDFTEELKVKLPLAESLVKSGKIQEGIDILLLIEKQTRTANDIVTLKATCKEILKLVKSSNDWNLLQDNILLLSRRRGQKSAALTLIVQESMLYLDELKKSNNEKMEIELIKSLRLISDGKIYVEKERAQLTQRLSRIHEKNGEIDIAADILQEVHVETYGAMTKLEKCEFILEQIRLTLNKKDYIRSFILSKKIQRKTLLETGFEECKLKFYNLMIEYHTYENDALELSKHWLSIYNTNIIQNDESKWKNALKHAILFNLLAPYSNHQSDMLHRLALEKKLDELNDFKNIVKLFTTKEIIAYPLPQHDIIQSHPIMNNPQCGEIWKKDFHTRVIEHNIRIISEYYEKIRTCHLSDMLGLSTDDAEHHISNLVSNGTIYAKMDRPAGIITFQKPQPSEEVLTNWSNDVSQLLRLVETTCRLIHKENMTYKV